MLILKKTAILFIFLGTLGLLFTGCDWSNDSWDSSTTDDTTSTGDSTDSTSDDTVDVVGTIEETYAESGPYTVTSSTVTGFKIFYPKNLEGNHPIITWGNGTGAPTLSYNALLTHLASWGFVVVASNSTMTQSGEEMIAGVDYLIEENNNPDSEFYNMLDTGSIGTTGHSQGGGGAINAATDSRITCTAPIAPAPGQIRNVTCPIFLIAGSADTIVSASLVRSMSYALATSPTIFGIIQGAGHMSFVGDGGQSRGYVTAWFRYHLKNDQVAQQAFEEDGEIFNNSDWNVERKNY